VPEDDGDASASCELGGSAGAANPPPHYYRWSRRLAVTG
jgi:hypothetical protein